MNNMQLIKRRLFAMRNGIIADVMRRGGSPHKIIFGVNLPQLVEIAADNGPNRDLAEALWANSTTRESMLLAPMIMPRDSFTLDDAHRWIDSATDVEVIDILCHRLLRHMPYAKTLAGALVTDSNDLTRYAGLRLWCNIAHMYPAEAHAAAVAEAERGCPLTYRLALSMRQRGQDTLSHF